MKRKKTRKTKQKNIRNSSSSSLSLTSPPTELLGPLGRLRRSVRFGDGRGLGDASGGGSFGWVFLFSPVGFVYGFPVVFQGFCPASTGQFIGCQYFFFGWNGFLVVALGALWLYDTCLFLVYGGSLLVLLSPSYCFGLLWFTRFTVVLAFSGRFTMFVCGGVLWFAKKCKGCDFRRKRGTNGFTDLKLMSGSCSYDGSDSIALFSLAFEIVALEFGFCVLSDLFLSLVDVWSCWYFVVCL